MRFKSNRKSLIWQKNGSLRPFQMSCSIGMRFSLKRHNELIVVRLARQQFSTANHVLTISTGRVWSQHQAQKLTSTNFSNLMCDGMDHELNGLMRMQNSISRRWPLCLLTDLPHQWHYHSKWHCQRLWLLLVSLVWAASHSRCHNCSCLQRSMAIMILEVLYHMTCQHRLIFLTRDGAAKCKIKTELVTSSKKSLSA